MQREIMSARQCIVSSDVRRPLLAALVLAITGSCASADSGAPWTAVWSVWSNCDCSGQANSEHIVQVCAAYGTIAAQSGGTTIDCTGDGKSVNVLEFADGSCAKGNVMKNTTYSVDQCLPHAPIGGGTMMSTFKCVRYYKPRAKSIVGKQYNGTVCDGTADANAKVIAETNYVSGCFPACSPHDMLPNLFQVANEDGLQGSYCNGTMTSCTGPCAPEPIIRAGQCQVLGKRTSIKYSYFDEM